MYMLLIADSGSTKTDWMLVDPSTNIQTLYHTKGINPMLQSETEINNTIASLPQSINEIDQIFFFGASCSSEDRKRKVYNGISNRFPNSTINIDHDISGAVVALCGNEDGIACILGTGSNSVLQKNKLLIVGNPALGFILGDEGSGADIGKRIVRDYLYDLIPLNIKQSIESQIEISKEIILEKVYRNENPNRYLASYTKTLSNHLETDYVRKVVKNSFTGFFEHHILCFENYKDYPCHFVGSIAFHFESILKEVGDLYDVKIGNIIKQPIEPLTTYIIKNNS